MQMTLEELQVGRSLLHRQAEATIQEADAQIKLNKGQYDHVGRLLVHVKVANLVQAGTCSGMLGFALHCPGFCKTVAALMMYSQSGCKRVVHCRPEG